MQRSLLPWLVGTCVGLAACGGDDSGGATPTSPPAAEATSPVATTPVTNASTSPPTVESPKATAPTTTTSTTVRPPTTAPATATVPSTTTPATTPATTAPATAPPTPTTVTVTVDGGVDPCSLVSPSEIWAATGAVDLVPSISPDDPRSCIYTGAPDQPLILIRSEPLAAAEFEAARDEFLGTFDVVDPHDFEEAGERGFSCECQLGGAIAGVAGYIADGQFVTVTYLPYEADPSFARVGGELVARIAAGEM